MTQRTAIAAAGGSGGHNTRAQMRVIASCGSYMKSSGLQLIKFRQ